MNEQPKTTGAAGCGNCKWKGLPVRDMKRRCRHLTKIQPDEETIAIVGGYPCWCDSWERSE